MAAGKKQKRRLGTTLISTPVVLHSQTPAPLMQPALTSEVLEGPVAKTAYFLTGLCLLVFLLFLLNGYRMQPYVIVDNFIPLFLKQANGSPQGIVSLFEDQVWKVETIPEGTTVLSVFVDKDKPAGFGIPKVQYPFNGSLSEVALSIQSIYTGYPVISYGFNRSIHLNNIIELGENALTQEFTPVMGSFKPLWIMPIYSAFERFAISTQEADILYVIIQSDRPTEMHINRMTLVGKS